MDAGPSPKRTQSTQKRAASAGHAARRPWKKEARAMIDRVLELLAQRQYGQLRQLLETLHVADIAELFSQIEERELRLRLFRLLPKDSAAETFSYMDPDIQQGHHRVHHRRGAQAHTGRHVPGRLRGPHRGDAGQRRAARAAQFLAGEPPAHQPVPPVPGGQRRQPDDQRIRLPQARHDRGRGARRHPARRPWTRRRSTAATSSPPTGGSRAR